MPNEPEPKWGDLDLELDSTPPPSPPRPQPNPPPVDDYDPFAEDFSGEPLEIDEGALRRHSGPHGEALKLPTPEEPTVEDDEYRASQLAAYGEPQTGLVGPFRYAVRVLQRRSELWRALEAEERVLAPLENQTTAALIAVADIVRRDAAQIDAQLVTEELCAVEEAIVNATAGERNQRLAQRTRHEIETRFAEERERFETDVAPLRESEHMLAIGLSAQEHELARVEARIKRLAIEKRNLSPSGRPPGSEPPADADAQRGSIQERESALIDERRSAEAKLAEARGLVQRAQTEIRSREHVWKATEDEQQRLRSEMDENQRSVRDRATEAERALAGAQCVLAEAALQRGLGAQVGEPATLAVRLLVARHEARQRVRWHRAALNVWDRPTIYRAIAYAAVPIVVLVVVAALI